MSDLLQEQAEQFEATLFIPPQEDWITRAPRPPVPPDPFAHPVLADT